jgi:hypothetical protein
MWKKRSVFCGAFSKQLVEIIKKKCWPQADLFRFPSVAAFSTALAPGEFWPGLW